MLQWTCEALWLKIILEDLIFKIGQWRFPNNNISKISTTNNPVQHNQIKHVKIDRHFIKEKLNNGSIYTHYLPINHQLAYMLQKSLRSLKSQASASKVAMENIHSSI